MSAKVPMHDPDRDSRAVFWLVAGWMAAFGLLAWGLFQAAGSLLRWLFH
jgi:hypothetical protein